MTNNKPLGEWTLTEAKAECGKRAVCRDRCPIFDNKKEICKLGSSPRNWDLTEPPRFTPDEEAALRVLKAAGYTSVFRDEQFEILWLSDDVSDTAGSLPDGLFPSIKPGQEVKL